MGGVGRVGEGIYLSFVYLIHLMVSRLALRFRMFSTPSRNDNIERLITEIVDEDVSAVKKKLEKLM